MSPGAERACHLGMAAVVGGLVGLVLLLVWDYQERDVRVVAVGTKDGISVLVTSGRRRVLIESGVDGTDSPDGLASYLTPLHRDIDVTLTDGRTGDGTMPRSRGSGQRWMLQSSTTDGPEPVGVSSTVTMPNDVSIDLLLEPGPAGEEQSWIASIRRGSAVVAVAGGDGRWVWSAVSQRDAGVVVMAADGRDGGQGLPYAAPLFLTPDRHVDGNSPSHLGASVVPVFPAQVVVFRLHERGIEVPVALQDRLDQPAATPSASSRPFTGTRASNSRRMSVRRSSERRTSRPAKAMALATRTAFR